MSTLRRLLMPFALIVATTVVGNGALAADAPTDAEIADAIARGVAYLKEQQQVRGHWSFHFNGDHTLGITALAGLALLENGVEPADPVIRKALPVVRELASESNQTYDIALAILFLARVQAGSEGEQDELIRELGARLARGDRNGMWTYHVPVDQPASRRRGRSESNLLAGGPGDNSNTQFALLGLWAASRHGFDSNDSLAAIDDHFRRSQEERGGWGYTPNHAPSEAMTCAGLMGLAIAAARPERAERLSARARGAALAADPAFTKALESVARKARDIGGASDVYYIWSLERVCVALGLRQLDGLDWYAKGAEELLGRQRGDGSWPDSRWGALPDTCLALLFLRKANLAFELDRVLKLPDPNRPQVALAAAAKPQANPQPPPAPPSDEPTVTIRGTSESAFPEITIDFLVANPDGTPLLDAAKEDFRVTEYDQPVNVLRFQSPSSKEIRPTTVVLVVDRSKSMEEENRIDGLKKAVATFLEKMPAGSRVAVIAFASEVNLICPFTSDKAQVQQAVDRLTPLGATRYYDAVAEALELLSNEKGRRAILALTDGEDTFSQHTKIEDVIKTARNAGLPIHTLGLGSEDEIASDDLRRLAADTRGQYFSAQNVAQLSAIYEELALELGRSYSLTYLSERKLPDGTLRPIKVFYRASKTAAETAVYIPGMVVPAAGWSWLFVLLIAALASLAVLPGVLRR